MNDIERIKRACKRLAGFEPSDKDIRILFKALTGPSKNVTKRLKEFGVSVENINQQAAP